MEVNLKKDHEKWSVQVAGETELLTASSISQRQFTLICDRVGSELRPAEFYATGKMSSYTQTANIKNFGSENFHKCRIPLSSDAEILIEIIRFVIALWMVLL